MRIGIIAEGPRDDTKSLLYNRLVQRVKLAGYHFKPINYRSTYNPVAWFARVVPDDPELEKAMGHGNVIDIGIVNGEPGLRVQQMGHATTWEQLEKLIKLRIEREKRLYSKGAASVTKAKGIIDILDGCWSKNSSTGMVGGLVQTKVNDSGSGVIYRNYLGGLVQTPVNDSGSGVIYRHYHFSTPQLSHADFEGISVSIKGAIIVPLQVARAASTVFEYTATVRMSVGPIADGKYHEITLSMHSKVHPSNITTLFSTESTKAEESLRQISISKFNINNNYHTWPSVREITDLSKHITQYGVKIYVPNNDLKDYVNKNVLRVLQMLVTGVRMPEIDIPQSMAELSRVLRSYRAEDEWYQPIKAKIEDYLPTYDPNSGTVSRQMSANSDELNLSMNTDYGRVKVKLDRPDDTGMHLIKIEPEQTDGITDDKHLTAKITSEQALDFFDTVNSMLEKSIVGENYRRKLDMIFEDDYDDIGEDLTAQIKEVLKDAIRKHPEIQVKRSNYVQKGNLHGLFTLSHPNAKRSLDILDNGNLVVGSYGSKKREVNTDAELEAAIDDWVTGKTRKAPRGPAAPPTDRNLNQIKQVSKRTGRVVEVPISSFFPYNVHRLNKKIPGVLVSKGKPFTLAISARDIDIPSEIFSSMDLHRFSKVIKSPQDIDQGPSYKHLGWIGGTVDGTSMHIDEVQSDLMQRTIEMTNQEQFDIKNTKTIEDIKSMIGQKRRELATMKREYQLAPVSHRLRLAQDINHAVKELKTAQNNAARRYKLTDFSQFKSKVENFYKNWIDAFYHACFNYARKNGVTDVYIISSAMISKIWSKARGKEEEEGSIYYRAYDKVAQNLGAEKVDDKWWHIKLDKITQREAKDLELISSLLTEHVLLEWDGVDIRRILQWLEHAGFTVSEIHGAHQEGDFRNLSMMVSKIIDGQAITTQEYTDINPEQLQRALSFVQYDVSATPVEENEYEVEELKRDAAILITAYKMIGDIPCGIAIASMEDPNMEMFVHEPESAGIGYGGVDLLNNPGYEEEKYQDDQMTDADLFGLSPEEMDDIWDRHGNT